MKNPIKICILQRGWVVIGRFSKDEGGNFTIESPCYVIRKWGTTGGLGQLAAEGPLAETKLDKTPEITGFRDSVIFTIAVDDDRWNDQF